MLQGSEASTVYPPPEGAEFSGRGIASRRPPPADDSFLAIVDRRVSVRSFADAPISDSTLHDALRVARLAPSAGNLQGYQIVIVRDADQKAEIARAAAGQTWIADAPAVLVFLADLDRSGRKYGERGRSLYAVQDATIAAAYAQLALEAAGLASCWVGAFREDLVAEAVGAPYAYGREARPAGSLRPVVVMPVGVAEQRHRRRDRRAIRDFVHQGYYTPNTTAGGGSSRGQQQR